MRRAKQVTRANRADSYKWSIVKHCYRIWLWRRVDVSIRFVWFDQDCEKRQKIIHIIHIHFSRSRSSSQSQLYEGRKVVSQQIMMFDHQLWQAETGVPFLISSRPLIALHSPVIAFITNVLNMRWDGNINTLFLIIDKTKNYESCYCITSKNLNDFTQAVCKWERYCKRRAL